MCGGGGFNPVQSITNAAESVGRSVANVATKTAGTAENVARNETLAKVMPLGPSLLTGSGRETIMATYGKALGPALAIATGGAAPGAAGVASSFLGDAMAGNTDTASSGWGLDPFLALLLGQGARTQQPGQPMVVDSVAKQASGSPSWMPMAIIGGIAAVFLVVLVVLIRRK